jgi:hypothetical protein
LCRKLWDLALDLTLEWEFMILSIYNALSLRGARGVLKA